MQNNFDDLYTEMIARYQAPAAEWKSVCCKPVAQCIKDLADAG